jgi:hypothetical protein
MLRRRGFMHGNMCVSDGIILARATDAKPQVVRRKTHFRLFCVFSRPGVVPEEVGGVAHPLAPGHACHSARRGVMRHRPIERRCAHHPHGAASSVRAFFLRARCQRSHAATKEHRRARLDEFWSGQRSPTTIDDIEGDWKQLRCRRARAQEGAGVGNGSRGRMIR